MIVQSVLSTRYVQIPVTATTTTGTPLNPTGDPVYFALIPDGAGQPGPGDWQGGTWAATTSSNGTYWAQILIGPANGGLSLGPGTYAIWYRVVDDPEEPEEPADILRII